MLLLVYVLKIATIIMFFSDITEGRQCTNVPIVMANKIRDVSSIFTIKMHCRCTWQNSRKMIKFQLYRYEAAFTTLRRLKKPSVMQEKYFPFSFPCASDLYFIVDTAECRVEYRRECPRRERFMRPSRSLWRTRMRYIMKRSDWCNNISFLPLCVGMSIQQEPTRYSLFSFVATRKDKRSRRRNDATRCGDVNGAAADPLGSVKHFSPAAHKYQRVLTLTFQPSFRRGAASRHSSSGPTERDDTKGIVRGLKLDSSSTASLGGDSIHGKFEEEVLRSYLRA